MPTSGRNRPSNSSAPKLPSVSVSNYWVNNIRNVVTQNSIETCVYLDGGSDNGEFVFILDVQDNIRCVSGHIEKGDTVLEIQGHKVAGFTKGDANAWLNYCLKNGNSVEFKLVGHGFMARDIRQFLNSRFQKGSEDHELQNIIRDNLYLRTVPVTTRQPRDGELNGVDYTFLSIEEFVKLEKSGSLLESGIYEGNYYGTPKPSKNLLSFPHNNGSSINTTDLPLDILFPGAHPSSEGKRKRNRSNVEAMAAKNMDQEVTDVDNLLADEYDAQCLKNDLGPLPYNWEKAYTETGEPYFIDHNSGTSHWLDPRLSKFQKKSLEECLDDELPYGWEKIDDPHYGTYYIDHVNRKTQYENPVIQAKQAALGSSDNRPVFTRNPSELHGERIKTTLVKSSRGLGFTIVGGDDAEEEFLQIKSLVPNGPAWLDGNLKTGDVLVFVNETCVLGFTHHDMVSVFQSITSGETVTLEVCRGYPLPFDPNDPNTEVVTTVAVNAPDTNDIDTNTFMNKERSIASESFNCIDTSSEIDNVQNSVDGMVNNFEFYPSEKMRNIQRPGSADILLNDIGCGDLDLTLGNSEFLNMNIVKGSLGFGFTIADSAYGQKVKKILDRERCKNLMEGDILVDINSINVRKMSHSEVVQVLKDCAQNQAATVTVQRGGTCLSNKSKLRKKDDLNVGKSMSYKDTIAGMFRSKTPTADLYSTQQKEIIPNRPKTPIVDTRNRPKTPTFPADRRPWSPFRDDGRLSLDIEGAEFDKNSNSNKGGTEDLLVMSPSGSYPGYKAYSSSSYPHPCDDTHLTPMSDLSDCLASTTLQDNTSFHLSHEKYSYNNSSMNCSDSIPYHQTNSWYKNYGHMKYKPDDPYVGNSDSPYDGVDLCGFDERTSVDRHKHYVSSPYVNEYVVDRQYEPPYDSRVINSFVNHKDVYHSEMRESESSKNISHPNLDFSDANSMCKRKESTSFEHEQPHSSTVTRFTRDFTHANMVSGIHNQSHSRGVPTVECVETVVTLLRQEMGFGFRIIGGTEEGSQVSIGHIVPRGAADLDGRLRMGDEIVSVDSQHVVGASHHHVVQLMGKAAASGRVTLGIRRRIIVPETNYSRSEICYPYDVTVTRRENEGFGFVIISSVNKSGSTIGRIIEGSPAEHCGLLHVGDRIISVNKIDIMNLHHGDIVNLIKDSGYSVTLTIGAPLDDASSSASASQRGEDSSAVEEEQYHAVELSRGTRGFGFSIRGGREFHNMPLFVLQIAECGPAACDGTLKVGDQIIEINGINTKTMTHAEAIEIIRNGGPTVRLLVRRGGKIFPHLPPPPPPLPPPPSSVVSQMNLSESALDLHSKPMTLTQNCVSSQSSEPMGHSSSHDLTYWDDQFSHS